MYSDPLTIKWKGIQGKYLSNLAEHFFGHFLLYDFIREIGCGENDVCDPQLPLL